MAGLERTPLYERHRAAGAKLVAFAGFEMPLQYSGVIAEHRAVRLDAGVFDVSHMGEIEVEGPQAAEILQRLLSNDITRLAVGGAQYTLLTNERGGVIDDLIVYRTGTHRYLLVVNAANTHADFAWIGSHAQRGVDVRDRSAQFALLAVAGPRALERLGLQPRTPFTFVEDALDGVEVMICATGYTGEEGVELACMAEDAVSLWDALSARGLTPCGLGARDTLRLEVCYPLHGNDIGPEWDPISGGLRFACALDTDFTGVEVLRDIQARGPTRRLVAFTMIDDAIPRKGMAIEGGGEVTSGSLSPMLEIGIGLGYVPAASAVTGTELVIDVRGRTRRARVAAKPIYQRKE